MGLFRVTNSTNHIVHVHNSIIQDSLLIFVLTSPDPSSTNTSRPLLSTKSGMYSLWRFLQGTAGERSWLFWLDAERIKYCSSRQDQIMCVCIYRLWYMITYNMYRYLHVHVLVLIHCTYSWVSVTVIPCTCISYRLLRRLCERYLTPGVPLEIPTDTKFRLGVSWLWIGGVAGVQALQDTLAESLRHYWYGKGTV